MTNPHSPDGPPEGGASSGGSSINTPDHEKDFFGEKPDEFEQDFSNVDLIDLAEFPRIIPRMPEFTFECLKLIVIEAGLQLNGSNKLDEVSERIDALIRRLLESARRYSNKVEDRPSESKDGDVEFKKVRLEKEYSEKLTVLVAAFENLRIAMGSPGAGAIPMELTPFFNSKNLEFVAPACAEWFTFNVNDHLQFDELVARINPALLVERPSAQSSAFNSDALIELDRQLLHFQNQAALCAARHTALHNKNQKISAKLEAEIAPFLKELIKLYKELTGNQPGYTTDIETGKRTGPTATFLSAICEWVHKHLLSLSERRGFDAAGVADFLERLEWYGDIPRCGEFIRKEIERNRNDEKVDRRDPHGPETAES